MKEILIKVSEDMIIIKTDDIEHNMHFVDWNDIVENKERTNSILWQYIWHMMGKCEHKDHLSLRDTTTKSELYTETTNLF